VTLRREKAVLVERTRKGIDDAEAGTKRVPRNVEETSNDWR
jgi:hypothetical protein